jgi:hypothetical protein
MSMVADPAPKKTSTSNLRSNANEKQSPLPHTAKVTLRDEGRIVHQACVEIGSLHQL